MVSGISRVDDDFTAEDLDGWRIMSGPDHHRAAERLLEEAESFEGVQF
jgi:hypothetical protein